MDQRFEGTPQAEICVAGRRALRGDVSHDWGSQLVWEVRRNGQVAAQVPARANADYQHPYTTLFRSDLKGLRRRRFGWKGGELCVGR